MILSFEENKAWTSATAPIMWLAWTTTVAGVTTSEANLTGTYTSDGWSPVTATGFVLYPAGNPSTVIGWANVTDFPDATLPSPITAVATWLNPWTNYCFKPYAINAIGTSYGVEVCFTTLTEIFIAEYGWNNLRKFNFATCSTITNLAAWGWPSRIKRVWWFIYVSRHLSNQLSKIDPVTMTIIATLSVPTQPSEMIQNWNFLYLLSATSWTLYKIDITTFTIISTIAIWTFPYCLCIVWNFIYCLRWIANIVTKVDITTFTVVATLPMPSLVWAWAWIVSDGTFIYAATQISIEKISIATFTIVASLATWTSDQQELALNWWFLYNSDAWANIVSKISLATFTVVSTLNLWAVWPSVLSTWTSNIYWLFGSNQIKEVDNTTMTVTNTCTVGTQPHHITF